MRIISFKADGEKTIVVPPNAKTNGKEILYSGKFRLASKKDLTQNPDEYSLICTAEKGVKQEEREH